MLFYNNNKLFNFITIFVLFLTIVYMSFEFINIPYIYVLCIWHWYYESWVLTYNLMHKQRTHQYLYCLAFSLMGLSPNGISPLTTFLYIITVIAQNIWNHFVILHFFSCNTEKATWLPLNFSLQLHWLVTTFLLHNNYSTVPYERHLTITF